MTEGAELLLPTLERARVRFEVPPEPPSVEKRLAAITVSARAQTRQRFEEPMELSVALADRLPRTVPELGAPELGDGWVTATHRCLARAAPPARCSRCAFRPGFESCIACNASGCIACVDGWLRCAQCDGTRETVKAMMHRFEDRDYGLRHTFVPDAAAAFAGRLVHELHDRVPDPALRFDLEARTAIMPYRSAEDAPRRVTLFGFEFEDALDRARTAVEKLTLKETLVRSAVEAWAWPLLLVEWPTLPPMILVGGAAEVMLLG